MTTPGISDHKLPLAFRVGVTGHIPLKTDAIKDLREAVAECLGAVRDKIDWLARLDAEKAVYRSDEAGNTLRNLRVVSPLAEGADRLVAEEGLRLGAELDVPLPFPQAEYERDFPASIDAFRRLLAKARVFELDGWRDGGPLQTESYEAVGRFVVRNCDLLIAIWDGERERGQGGAAQIVRFAVRVGVPVWWIHEFGTEPPKLLLSALDLNAPGQALSGEAALARLRKLVGQAIVPPETPPPAGRPVRIVGAGHLLCVEAGPAAAERFPCRKAFAALFPLARV